jgi:hypothetical protein
MDTRTRRWLRAGAMVVAATVAAPVLTAGGGVRPLQARGTRLLEEASRRSATVRELVDELGRSDVVVYVDLDGNDPSDLDGSLRFMGATANTRNVHVWLQPRHSDSALMPTLAHELQHAVEVARATDVRSAERFEAMYAALGTSANPRRYETAAAQDVGVRVRRELDAHR